MRLRSMCCSLLTIAALLSAEITPGQNTDAQTSALLAGYTRTSSAAESALEKNFQDGIVPGNIRENMRRLSARPHHVGSPYDKDNAEWILARMQE
jgi:N-acetylated-alpha-linked acidic dipeptidase